MEQNIFWTLVRHEFSQNGDRRKMAKRKFSRKWWIIYIITCAIIGFGFITFLSFQKGYQLVNVWFFTLGLPYMVFFCSFGIVKKEWNNGTQGWWLTLPYSRNRLVFAKYIAALFQVLLVVVAVYVAGIIMAIYLTLLQNHYSSGDLVTFVTAGTAWLEILITTSPIILAFGLFTAAVHYTTLRPITPILWFVFMGLGSFVYWGIGWNFDHSNNLFAQFAGEEKVTWFPFSEMFIVVILSGWILAYAILRFSAYLLDKKLTM